MAAITALRGRAASSNRLKIVNSEQEDHNSTGLMDRVERTLGVDVDGDGVIGKSGESGAQESGSYEARSIRRFPVDLSRWFLQLRVNRMQGNGFQEDIITITEDAFAFGDGPRYKDVIAMEVIVRCADMSELRNETSSLLWKQSGTYLFHVIISHLHGFRYGAHLERILKTMTRR